MVEIFQGLKYLNNKNKIKEPFVDDSDIKIIEKRFNKQLEKFETLYKTLAISGNKMSEQEKNDLKIGIGQINKDMMKTSNELYEKIISFKKDNKAGPNLNNIPLLLQKYQKYSNLYDDLNDKGKVATFAAQEEDFQLKTNMGRIRYIIWASLAIIIFISSIVWLVMTVEFPKPVKIGIIGITTVVGLAFLSAIWAVAIKYCRGATKKGFLCSIVFFLNRFFKGAIDFFNNFIF